MKQVKGLKNYYATETGKVYKEWKYSDGSKKLKEVAQSLAPNGAMKFNLGGKVLLVHDVVYRAFKGDYEGILVFLDGDKTNCNISNLISIAELTEFYNRFR